jgi:hypothetical protein
MPVLIPLFASEDKGDNINNVQRLTLANAYENTTYLWIVFVMTLTFAALGFMLIAKFRKIMQQILFFSETDELRDSHIGKLTI